MPKIQVISEYDAMQSFEEMLDDIHPVVKIGCLSFAPSEVLRRLDQPAYREEFIQYCDAMADNEAFLVEGYTDDLVEEVEEE